MSGITCEIRHKGPSLIDKLLRLADKNAEAIVDETAEDGAKYIRAHWSGASPSAPGSPPAVVSGELDKSVIAIPEHSLSSGKKRSLLRAMAKYARPLEFGTHTMKARPFMRPAMHYLRKTFKGRFKGRLFK